MIDALLVETRKPQKVDYIVSVVIYACSFVAFLVVLLVSHSLTIESTVNSVTQERALLLSRMCRTPQLVLLLYP